MSTYVFLTILCDNGITLTKGVIQTQLQKHIDQDNQWTNREIHIHLDFHHQGVEIREAKTEVDMDD
jgi:hypothetical protein